MTASRTKLRELLNPHDIFAHRYTEQYPDDFYSIGIIAPHNIWESCENEDIQGNIPKTNPVWNYPLASKFNRSMGPHQSEWFLVILELEMEYGTKVNKKSLELTVCPTEDLFTLGKQHEIHNGWGNDDDEMFLPGRRVGFLKYPTSSGHDLWMFLDPSQESIEEMNNIQDAW